MPSVCVYASINLKNTSANNLNPLMVQINEKKNVLHTISTFDLKINLAFAL